MSILGMEDTVQRALKPTTCGTAGFLKVFIMWVLSIQTQSIRQWFQDGQYNIDY